MYLKTDSPHARHQYIQPTPRSPQKPSKHPQIYAVVDLINILYQQTEHNHHPD